MWSLPRCGESNETEKHSVIAGSAPGKGKVLKCLAFAVRQQLLEFCVI